MSLPVPDVILDSTDYLRKDILKTQKNSERISKKRAS